MNNETNKDFTDIENSLPRTSDKLSLKTVVILVWVVLAIGATSFLTGRHVESVANANSLAERLDEFKDLGNHNLHHGDCYIVKEFLSQDGSLHVEFELKKELELSFEMIDSEGYTVWKSPFMKDAPGHHEIKWDPVHRDGAELPMGEYSLAVQIENEKVIIGAFKHQLASL